MLVTALIPPLTGLRVHVNDFPPLSSTWQPRVGIGTIPAIVIGLMAIRWAAALSSRLAWNRVLVLAFFAGLSWLFALALVDGVNGIAQILGTSNEYLPTARATIDVGATLHEFTARIPYGPRHWPVHVTGHPPGALLFFVGLVRLGLGTGLGAGIAVTVIAATTTPAVLVTLRELGAEDFTRKAAPFLVFGPAAIWQSVSADAMFAAVAAWAVAALACAVRRHSISWSLVSGLLFGLCVMFSYGLPLLGILALTVLVLGRSWFPLPLVMIAAAAVVLAFAAYGFLWWQALPVLRSRYFAGIASTRPSAYWLFGNVGALMFATGPWLGAGLAAGVARLRDPSARVVVLLVAAGVLMVSAADISLMSKAEVERIWLPFAPWLLLSCALLPARWRQVGLVAQVGFALLLQHLTYSIW